MPKITLGNKEFIPPTINPPEPTSQSHLRKLSKKEVLILIGVVSSLLIVGWLPTQLIYKAKLTKLEQKIEQLDPLHKIEIDLNHKLDKLEQDLKVEDDDLYKILSKLRSDRRLQILNQLEQIQLFKSRQNILTFEFFNIKKEELKQKELLYHR